jgi:hypothetical protein
MANIFGSATSLKQTPTINTVEQFENVFPNFKVSETNHANPNYVNEQTSKQALSAASSEAKDNMLKTVENNLIDRNELPESMNINLVSYFGSVAEANNYNPDTKEVQLAFRYNSDTHQLINQLYSVSGDEAYNNKLTNDFLEDHEYSHSVNYHQREGFIKIHDPISNLTQEEKKAVMTNDTFKDTIDENFADAYGSIILLKNNNFSKESIDVVKKIRDIRDKMSHQNPVEISMTHYDPHSSAYTLDNILNNIETIKKINDPTKLKDIAIQSATHGSLAGIKHYKNEHDFSLAYSLNANYATVYQRHLFNEINKGKKDFKSLDEDWSSMSVEDRHRIESYVKQNKDNKTSINKAFNIDNMDWQTVVQTQEAMKGAGLDFDLSQVAFILQKFNNAKTFDSTEARAQTLKDILINDNTNKTENDYATKLQLFENVDKKIDNLPEAKLVVNNDSSIQMLTVKKEENPTQELSNVNTENDYTLPNLKDKIKSIRAKTQLQEEKQKVYATPSM